MSFKVLGEVGRGVSVGWPRPGGTLPPLSPPPTTACGCPPHSPSSSQLTQALCGRFNSHVHVEYEWRLLHEDLDESDDDVDEKLQVGARLQDARSVVMRFAPTLWSLEYNQGRKWFSTKIGVNSGLPLISVAVWFCPSHKCRWSPSSCAC